MPRSQSLPGFSRPHSFQNALHSGYGGVDAPTPPPAMQPPTHAIPPTLFLTWWDGTIEKMEDLSDEDLVVRYRQDADSPAGERYINELFRRYHKRVATWCYRLAGDG